MAIAMMMIMMMMMTMMAILGNQPAADRRHKPGGRMSFTSAKPAVTSSAAEHRILAGTIPN